MIKAHLTPPKTKGHTSVACLKDHWYVVCKSKDLRGPKPMSFTLLGIPLVLFRGKGGTVGALLDRCPHRNVPLSIGMVRGDHIECGYHGWRFNPKGDCTLIPGLCTQTEGRGRHAPSFEVREKDGLVWVYGTPDVEPSTEPFDMPFCRDKRYTTVCRRLLAPASVHATIENALDVPHTAFLHKGLFRGSGEPNEIRVVIRRWHDRVEAQYIGEPRPEGIFGRLLSPSGGMVEHYDRFYLPSIGQVEYSIGEENHILVNILCTPLSDFETQLVAVINYRLRIPNILVKPLLEPIARMIFYQDVKILKHQTDSIACFGGEQFISTDLDALGPHIWRLMAQAQRGQPSAKSDDPFTKEILMHV